MSKPLIPFIALGLAAGMLGPVTDAVGAQSGSHPNRNLSDSAYADLRRAANGHWYANDYEAGVKHQFIVNTFRHDEVYGGTNSDEISYGGNYYSPTATRYFNGRVTLKHRICVSADTPSCSERITQADLGPMTGNSFAMTTADGGARLRATLPRTGSSPCTLIVDWSAPPHALYPERTVNADAIQTQTYTTAVAQGSCVDVPGLNAENWGQLWSRDEVTQTSARGPSLVDQSSNPGGRYR